MYSDWNAYSILKIVLYARSYKILDFPLRFLNEEELIVLPRIKYFGVILHMCRLYLTSYRYYWNISGTQKQTLLSLPRKTHHWVTLRASTKDSPPPLLTDKRKRIILLKKKTKQRGIEMGKEKTTTYKYNKKRKEFVMRR